MISVGDLVRKIRAKLRDEDGEDGYRFKDGEILDALNSTYLDLNHLFKLNIKKYEKHISPDDAILRTDRMFLSFEGAYLSGLGLRLRPFNERASALQIASFSDFQSLIVQPTNKAAGILVVYVNESVKLEASSVLSAGDYLENALIFGVLVSIFQTESNENNLQRVNFYEALYKKETDRLRALIADTREPRSFQTYFNY